MSLLRTGKKIGCVAVVLGALVAGGAREARAAEPTAADRAVAESLFRQAREQMTARNYSDACPKFAESYRLDAALGTLLNLAVCHEQQGKIASAWIEFTDAVSEAKRLGQPDREALARRKAASLEPKLTYLTVQVPDRVGQLPQVEVHLDGMLIGRATWGSPFPVDDGEHRIEVTARGKKPRSQVAQVARGARQANVSVEMPEDLPADETPPSPAATDVPFQSTPSAPVARTQTETTSRGRTQHIAGIVVGAAGIVSLGVAGAFSLAAIDDKSQRDAACDAQKRCSPAGLQADHDGRVAANVATVTSIAGLALVGAGLAIFFTAPRSTVSTAASAPNRSLALVPSAGANGGGVTLAGAW